MQAAGGEPDGLEEESNWCALSQALSQRSRACSWILLFYGAGCGNHRNCDLFSGPEDLKSHRRARRARTVQNKYVTNAERIHMTRKVTSFPTGGGPRRSPAVRR